MPSKDPTSYTPNAHKGSRGTGTTRGRLTKPVKGSKKGAGKKS